MSESNNTNELDSYGVWVKNPPKTVDSSINQDSAVSDFNIETDLPDFSELDSITENSSDFSSFDSNNISENLPSQNQEEEISLDEFITDGIFETGPDEDKIQEKEAESSMHTEQTPVENIELSEPEIEENTEESVSLTDSNDFNPSIENETVEAQTPQQDFTVSDSDDMLNIDLDFEDESSSNEQISSASSENSFETPENTNNEETEDVDLSEFGLDDFSTSEEQIPVQQTQTPTFENTDGMENIDLSEFGFDDIDDIQDSSKDEENFKPENNTEEQNIPSLPENNIEEENPSLNETENKEEIPSLNETEIQDTTLSDMDEEIPALTENDLEENFEIPDENELSQAQENISEEEIPTIQEDSIIEEEKLPSQEEISLPETEENQNEELTLDNQEEIFDSLEENNDKTVKFTESIKAPILEEMENDEEKPSTQMTAIFNQIVSELSSLKNEIADLKDELKTMKISSPVQETQEIEIPEEKEQAGFFANTDEDETIALSTDELDNILNTADFTQKSTEEENIENQKSEEIQEIPEIETAEENGNSEEEINFESPEQIQETQKEEELSAEDEIPFATDDFDSIDESYSLDDEPIFAENDNFNFDDNEGFSLPEENSEVEEELPEEISIPKGDDDIFVESSSQDFIEASSSASETDSNNEEIEVVEEIPDNEEIEPVEEENISFDEISTDDFTFEENEEEKTSIEDSLTEEKLQFLQSDVEEKENENSSVQENKAQNEEISVPQESISNENESFDGELKTEIKSVLSYMDQLLENLPEEKIEEFAQSEQFDTYKKLFKKLGLA